MPVSVQPIRWGVVLDGVPIGEVWQESGELHACAFVGGDRHMVPLEHGELVFPQNAGNAVRDWLATVRVFDPSLSRSWRPGDSRAAQAAAGETP